MRNIDWRPTIRGYKALLMNNAYILEIWSDSRSGGWITAVNAEMIIDDETNKSKIFATLDEAKKAAEGFAGNMMKK